jgi:hypothetical protein
MFLSAQEVQVCCLLDGIGIAVGSSEDRSEDSSISQLEEDT